MGVPCQNLQNKLTQSEQRLDLWQKEKEEERLESIEEELDGNGNAVTKPVDVSYMFRDKTSYFHFENVCNYGDEFQGVAIYKATETNLVRSLEYIQIARNTLRKDHLSAIGVFFLDTPSRIFVWIGSKCPHWQHDCCILFGQVESLLSNLRNSFLLFSCV